jgi:hypothetical protein
VIALLIPYAVLGLIGGYIAAHKGYPPVWGILAGILIGPVALVIALCLPATSEAREQAALQRKTGEELA